MADQVDVWSYVAPALAMLMNIGMNGNADALEPTVLGLSRTARRLRGLEAVEDTKERKQKKSVQQRNEEIFNSHPLFRVNVPHLVRNRSAE